MVGYKRVQHTENLWNQFPLLNIFLELSKRCFCCCCFVFLTGKLVHYEKITKESWYNNKCIHTNSLQSCSTLCDPLDCKLPGSSVHGILQARILEWIAMPSSRGSSQPRNLMSPALAAEFFTTAAKSLQSWLTLCDPMDYNLPGSSVHRILQARILEWVAMSSSRGSSWPMDWTRIS